MKNKLIYTALLLGASGSAMAEAVPLDTTDMVAQLALGTAIIAAIGVAKLGMGSLGVVYTWAKGFLIGG